MSVFTKLTAVVLTIGFMTSGCGMSSRVLKGNELILSTFTISSTEEQVIQKRGVGLFRLVPTNGTRVAGIGAALYQSSGQMIGLAVEGRAIAYGSYAGRKIQFILPPDFEPGASCFTVVAASGYVVATSIASADKRYLLGLRPYSKQFRSSQAQDGSLDGRTPDKAYSGVDLECEGTIADFVNNHVPSVGW